METGDEKDGASGAAAGSSDGADGTASPAPAAPTPDERIAELEKEKSALAAEKEEQRNRMLRIAADFENWKKRARKDQQEAEQSAKEKVLRDVLEVVDNLERAIEASTRAADPLSVVQGVNLVLRLFQNKLERYEVRAIQAQGQPFDPRLHEAIGQESSAEVSPGTVIREMQKGYRVGERLLRPAVVSVAVAPSAPAMPAEAAPPDEKAGDAEKAGADGHSNGAGDGEAESSDGDEERR